MVTESKLKPFAIFDSTLQEFQKKGREKEPYYMEAYFLYSFYYSQALKQDTHSVYCTKNWTMEVTGISVRKLHGARDLLQRMGLISEYEYSPEHNKYFFTVKVDTLVDAEVGGIRSVGGEGGTERICNSPTNIYSPTIKPINININESSLEKPTDKQKFIRKDIAQEPEEKEKPLLVKKIIRPSFVDSNGKYRETKKNVDSIEIAANIKHALEYWNSKEELVTHTINEDSPSKTLLHCVQLIKMFFSGKLIKHALLPKNFDQSLWKGGRQTLEDWKYFVDEICLCLNDPGLLPKKNGKALALPVFLEGSERLELPAFIFNYCLGDYKTATVDVNPKNTIKIKTFWEQLIGKFKDTPENQKAFVAISNLSEQTFAERRKVNKNWIPAMNEYFPANIVKSILRQNLWIKEKGHQPVYMDTKFFKGMVSRYDYDRTTGKIIF